ncbi:hypothetical protein KR215_010642, partial [Drosophila sulfurigaster]
MSQIDYTCYTVPECSSDDGDDDDDDRRCHRRRDDSSDGTLENVLQSDCTLDSDATTTSSMEHHHHHRQHIYRQQVGRRNKRCAPQRISLPTLTRELTPQLGVFHEGPETAPQWGYFVPLSPNGFLSPPMQRRFREKENDRNRRAVSYGGGDGVSPPHCATIPRAA